MTLRKYILENINSTEYYHGTKSLVPFDKFDPKLDGTGIVSIGSKKYGGFFFTNDIENADYFTEYWICKVSIKDIEKYPYEEKMINDFTKKSIKDNKIYQLDNVFDGGKYSDIIFVPHSKVNNITIDEWILYGDEEFWIESIMETFGVEEDEEDEYYDPEEPYYINGDMILDFYRETGMDINIALKNKTFKNFVDSIGGIIL